MRFVTKTRLDYLQSMIQAMGNDDEHKLALHILESIKRDIEENYAEIKKPIRLHDKLKDRSENTY
ncbi:MULTISPECIES: hypothetical protein [Paenibacillus]|uniref:Uncharacterized protein n=1 Tax=Paenibacillus naphthalenovorans TaxID=162209 RepID=A0A0U2W7F9_9BACL|nr:MULTISPECIES: hypothetical protein [Paenibacillus]ALS22382.1 hypothetical protein IJ22_20080 [Paenibacillus naphthalenovorans]NTZ16845.1 hypothetical protein [Paenibacillus sp. JMULE4]GCL70171.1 hypothetical protein PN4B1_00710 [Paenibacillus naphthalenovorans]SDH89896.1 hypothetical protein SAMN05421868_101492 [Paenibacillus naphthalenovorans]